MIFSEFLKSYPPLLSRTLHPVLTSICYRY
jgi:hypothetical protein